MNVVSANKLEVFLPRNYRQLSSYFDTLSWSLLELASIFMDSTCRFFLNSIEAGRPRILRYPWQLILMPNLNDSGHVALFIKPKRWTHMLTFLTLIIGQVEKWHSWSTKEGECMFAETQSLKVLLVAAFYCIITLLCKQESQQWERNVMTSDQLFGCIL